MLSMRSCELDFLSSSATGDPLTLVVSIDNQNIYGMHISECMVKDGLGWSEQRLINGEG